MSGGKQLPEDWAEREEYPVKLKSMEKTDWKFGWNELGPSVPPRSEWPKIYHNQKDIPCVTK